jgi:hypothetical protein
MSLPLSISIKYRTRFALDAPQAASRRRFGGLIIEVRSLGAPMLPPGILPDEKVCLDSADSFFRSGSTTKLLTVGLSLKRQAIYSTEGAISRTWK